jgi:hypothetical protein
MSGSGSSEVKGSGKKGKGKDPETPPPDNSGTLLGLPSGFKRKDNAPGLAFERVNSDGALVGVDFWSDVMQSNDNLRLFKILEVAKSWDAYDLVDFVKGIEYQGFDRIFFIKHCLSLMSVAIFVQFAIIGAVRGSNFTRIVETCEVMPQSVISAFSRHAFVKTPKKKTDLTILRCTSSIPQWCAYWMHKAEVSKKIESDPCPAWLQFPGAASLPLSRDLRFKHLKFCENFSSILPGGHFKATIYLTAYRNMIPLSEIPSEIQALLGVSSDSEANSVTATEINDSVSKALISASK